MSRNRHQARVLAMQVLCQLDVQGGQALDEAGVLFDAADAAPATARYARQLAQDSWQQRRDLSRRINRHLEHWDVQRLSPVVRNVIRVALIELSFGDVPPKVVLNEAVEIAREFGGADSPGFVNGVLDAMFKLQDGTTAGTSGTL
ncbi:MAG: transcription antitermination factor NusB [bacterium]|nr:transcription antitermination factor NusB [bacterium]